MRAFGQKSAPSGAVDDAGGEDLDDDSAGGGSAGEEVGGDASGEDVTDGASARPALSDAEVRDKVTQIDATERKIGLGGAALAVVIGLFGLVPGIEHRGVKAGKHHSCPSGYTYAEAAKECAQYAHRSVWVWELVIVLVFALAIFVTVRIGRRSAVAFALVMAGFALEFAVQSILAVVFIFAGGWLVVRAWRVQRYGSPNASAAVRRAADKERRTSRSAGSGRGATRAGSGTASRRGDSKGKSKANEVVTASGRPKPDANKRYTPKSPPRKKPPPPS